MDALGAAAAGGVLSTVLTAQQESDWSHYDDESDDEREVDWTVDAKHVYRPHQRRREQQQQQFRDSSEGLAEEAGGTVEGDWEAAVEF